MFSSWLTTWRPRPATAGMFFIVFSLHLAFALLRSARMAIAVTDLGGSAACLPLFEIFAAVPLSIVVMAVLNRVMRNRSLSASYSIATGGFLLFFGLFAFVAYPSLATLTMQDPRLLSPHDALWRQIFLLSSGGLFYAVSELWRTVLLTVLFWSATNHLLSSKDASRHYPRLVLAGSLGAMAAGPVASWTASPFWGAFFATGGSTWEQTLQLMTLVIAMIGIATACLFPRLLKLLKNEYVHSLESPSEQAQEVQGDPCSSSLRESFKICGSSLPLLFLAVSTLTDYLSYSLGEIVFLDVLKQWAPAPQDYYRSMGMLGTVNGVLTALGGAWLAPWWFRRLGWGAAAAATPVAIAVLGGSFCALVWFEPSLVAMGLNAQSLLTVAVVLGSCHYCICRATKYTLFDPAKELAFMKLAPVERMPGKMVVDGIVSRLGRGCSSVLTLGLTSLSGSLRATAGLGGLIASCVAGVGIFAALSLNRVLYGKDESSTSSNSL